MSDDGSEWMRRDALMVRSIFMFLISRVTPRHQERP